MARYKIGDEVMCLDDLQTRVIREITPHEYVLQNGRAYLESEIITLAEARAKLAAK